MKRLLLAVFSLAAYVAFLATFVYLIGFASDIGVARTVDGTASGDPLLAAAIDAAVIAAFGVVHSVMARAAWKRAWTRIVPLDAERSVFVLVATAQLALLVWQWRPLGPVLWATTGVPALVLRALQAAGWSILLVSTFLIDHFELFGLRQGFGRPASKGALRTPLLYRFVRHPMYFGMIVGFWCSSVMTGGHVLLAALFTAYLVIGARYEERDLIRLFGDDYTRYRARVPMLLPRPRR